MIKAFNYWEAVKLMVEIKSFPNFQFSFESLSFIIGNEYCRLSLKQEANLIHFEKISAKYPWLNNHLVCQSRLLAKLPCHEKRSWSTSQQKQLHKCFSSRWPWYSVFHRNSYFIITWDIKNTCIQGSDFPRINHFYCFAKDILKWNWHFGFFVTAWHLKNAMTSITAGGHCLDFCWSTGSFILYCFCSITANVTTVKETITFSYYFDIILTTWTPERILWNPNGLWPHFENSCIRVKETSITNLVQIT